MNLHNNFRNIIEWTEKSPINYRNETPIQNDKKNIEYGYRFVELTFYFNQ